MAGHHSRSATGERKIRDSCNNCSSQKIRCGKQRPSCARCSNKGLECNYSYSQRTGRRTASANLDKDLKPIYAPSLTNISPVNENPPPLLYELHTTSEATTGSPLSTSVPASAFPTGSPTDNVFDFDDANFFQELGMDFLQSTTPDNACQLDSLRDIELPDAETIAQLPHISHLPDSRSSDDSTKQLHYTGNPSVTTLPKFEKTYHDDHNCMSLALKVVYDLHASREPCSMAESDSMTFMPSSNQEMRDVDAVLLLNRDSARSIKRVLNCSCSNDFSVSLICYQALSKIVDWYGAVIGLVNEGVPDGNGNTKLLESDSAIGAMSQRIIARPIFLGKYCLDPEIHRAVRAQVVIKELKENVQPLISRLPRYHMSLPIGGMDPSSPMNSKDIHNSEHSCMLRNQLRLVLQSATTAQTALRSTIPA